MGNQPDFTKAVGMDAVTGIEAGCCLSLCACYRKVPANKDLLLQKGGGTQGGPHLYGQGDTLSKIPPWEYFLPLRAKKYQENEGIEQAIDRTREDA